MLQAVVTLCNGTASGFMGKFNIQLDFSSITVVHEHVDHQNNFVSCNSGKTMICFSSPYFDRFGSIVAFFQYSPIDILSVYLPPSILKFNGHGEQTWVRKEASEVCSTFKKIFWFLFVSGDITKLFMSALQQSAFPFLSFCAKPKPCMQRYQLFFIKLNRKAHL